MSNSGWSREERRQVVASGLAPLAVSLALSGIAFVHFGTGSFFLLFALLPFSYATLFFFVLPSLWLLRRFWKETVLSFSLVCGVATIAPWLALYVLLAPAGKGKYSGAPVQALLALLLPALFAAFAGAVVYRLGFPAASKNAA